MKKLFVTSLMFIAVSFGPGSAIVAAPANGGQAIGFANFHEADVREMATMYVKSGGELELSFLPFEFNQNNPFLNATRFVQAVLPGLNGRLTIKVYLYFHDYSYQARFDWDAFRPGSNARFRNTYLRRVAAFDAWASGMRAWAAQQGAERKLNIILSPFLEDDCPSPQAYNNLLNAIAQQQRSDNIRTPIRRSSLGNNAFRISGIPLEVHGAYSSASRFLQSGDTYSNDGTVVPVSDFLEAQGQARRRGISVLYWSAAYNGLDVHSRGTPPSQRRRLTPFTGPNGQREKDALLRVLRNR
jgi:hypothetical protein